MKKRIFSYLSLALTIAAGVSVSSCVESDNSVYPDSSSITETITQTEPTTDQMSVTVTANLPTAVLGTIEDGSTAAALVKRLPKTTASVDADTRMMVIPGSLFDNFEEQNGLEVMKDAARLAMKGGYVCLTTPNTEQAGVFALTFLYTLLTLEEEFFEQMFDVSSDEAAASARSSQQVERLKTRMATMKNVARTRGESDDDDAPFAEMIILGPNDYFMQAPFEEEFTSYVSESDEEGNTTEEQAVTGKSERTPAISGMMADAAAEWLNDTEKTQEAAAARAMTRGTGTTNINELMDASETFTFTGNIKFIAWDNRSRIRYNRVKMKVSSWGVHNMETNKDYYYLKQNVTLCMGEQDGLKIFYPVSKSNTWYDATNFGEFNNWFGAFLSKYETSMNLSGDGSIHLEASAPNTDNNTANTTVSTGSSYSQSETVGISWGASGGANMSGPMGSISVGGSYSVGTTTGSSFSIGMQQSNKELGVKKNTKDTKVTWTYTGALPKYYENVGSRIYYCHQTPAAILINDADVCQEICWSVDNPAKQYTVNITSTPETAALLFVHKVQDGYKNAANKYVYDKDGGTTYSQDLIEPNRAMQSWRMYVTIDEWAASPVVGAQGELESNIRNAFPDLYASNFKIADKTATSLNTIGFIVKKSKDIMSNNVDILQSYAKSWGIKKFTIHWRCDDRNVTTREGFTVTAD